MKYLSTDIRALALMRICIAFVIILDLSIRISDLEAFYASTGAVPLAMVFEHVWNNYHISLHTISGLWQVQFVLFMVAYFCAIMLLIGYRTRLFTILSWFMMMSLHNRNELILQGGDDLLRTVLFWAIFLPWGARYSYDRLQNPQQFTEQNIRTPATVAYMLQVFYVYTGSALLKGHEWNTDFTALYYVYSLDQIAYPITKYLYNYPDLMKVLTAIAYYFELLVPVLFFIPVKHQFFRLAGIILIFGFHLFNGMSVFIGLFFIIGMATAVGLFPTFAMDYFDKKTKWIKLFFARSFRGIAYPIQYIIPWKKPAYIYPLWQRRVNTAVLTFLIVYVFYWNLANLHWFNYKMPQQLEAIAHVLRIDQSWGMFSPGVFKDDGWYILEAETLDGKKIDLMHPNEPLTYSKPANIVKLFKNDRWRKYSENMLFTFHDFMRGYFCNYYKRAWNDNYPDMQIKSLKVIYMLEITRPDYQYSHPQKEILFVCYPPE